MGAFYDDNNITIDGHTELSGTEDVGAIRKAIAEAKACTDKPTLIKVKTVIGFGAPNKADSHDVHGQSCQLGTVRSLALPPEASLRMALMYTICCVTTGHCAVFRTGHVIFTDAVLELATICL